MDAASTAIRIEAYIVTSLHSARQPSFRIPLRLMMAMTMPTDTTTRTGMAIPTASSTLRSFAPVPAFAPSR